MVYKYFFFLPVVFMSVISNASCPSPDSKETTLDCPWAEISRKISTTPKHCLKILKKDSPKVLSSLKNDRKNKNIENFWGEAKNFDDNAKAIIVDPAVITCLENEIGLRSARRKQGEIEIVHAGLQHTYSYLFSNIDTPYGYKRSRWVSGEVQEGLGLPAGFLLPQTAHSAFLTQVTYLFTKLAYGDNSPQLLAVSDSFARGFRLPTELKNLSAEKFHITTLLEQISGTEITLRSTFVELRSDKQQLKNSHLLIYSIDNLKTKKHQLITGFPIDQASFKKSTDVGSLGDEKMITIRYNAWVTGISENATGLKGKRSIMQ